MVCNIPKCSKCTNMSSKENPAGVQAVRNNITFYENPSVKSCYVINKPFNTTGDSARIYNRDPRTNNATRGGYCGAPNNKMGYDASDIKCPAPAAYPQADANLVAKAFKLIEETRGYHTNIARNGFVQQANELSPFIVNCDTAMKGYAEDPNIGINTINSGITQLNNEYTRIQKIVNDYILNQATAAINTANTKNAPLDSYASKYKTQKIDLLNINNAVTTYKQNPNNANYTALSTAINNVNNKTVPSITQDANLISRADTAKKNADNMLTSIGNYGGNLQNRINNQFVPHYNAYKTNQNTSTHQNLESKITDLENAVKEEDGLKKARDLAAKKAADAETKRLADAETKRRAGIQTEINNTADTLNKARTKNTTLGNYGINQIDVATVPQVIQQYQNNQSDGSNIAYHHERLKNRLNKINEATAAIDGANKKNDTLNAYSNQYSNSKINIQPVINAINTYNNEPNPTNQTPLDNAIRTLNGQNVPGITANADLIQKAKDAVLAANDKNKPLQAYSSAYSGSLIDTSRVNNAIKSYNTTQSNATDAELQFAIDLLNKINVPPITSSGDLIAKAKEQIDRGNTKKQEYQNNTAYVNFVSSLNQPINDCQSAKDAYSKDPNNTTATNIVNTTNTLKNTIDNLPTITTPKPTANKDLLTKADTQLDDGTKLSKELQNNPAYVNFVSTLNTPMKNCDTAYTAYIKNPNTDTATTLVNATNALKKAIDEVPKRTTPKPTANKDLLTKADTQLDAGTNLSDILKKNPAYVSFATSLATSVQDCQTAYTAYDTNPNTSTAQKLVSTTDALKIAIAGVPTITTTPKPTANKDLLTKVKNKLDEGTKLSNELQNNPAYASFAVSLSTPIQDCQAAYTAYDTNPKISTAEKLEITFNTLEKAINIVPARTTPKPTANKDLLKDIDAQIKIGNDLSTAFQNNKAYMNVGLGLNNIINECQISRQAYVDNANDNTAENLVTSMNKLKTSIGKVPDITTPKPTANKDLLDQAGLQLDAGTQTVGLLRKSAAYASVASELDIVIKECQTAYDAYDTNPTTNTAADLTSKTDILKTAISKIPKITTPMPTPTSTSISFTSIPTTSTSFTSTPFTSIPTTITTMFGGVTSPAVTLNPAVVNVVDTKIKIAENKLSEIKNNISLATKEPFGTDLDSQINDVKSKLQAYKLNPTTDTTNALMQSAAVLTKTMDIIVDIPVSDLVNNMKMYGDILGNIVSSALTLPMTSITTIVGNTYTPTFTTSIGNTYGPTPTMSPSNTYTPTFTTSPGSTYGPTSTMAPGSTYGPTFTTSPGSTYGPTSTMAPGSTYGPTSSMSPGSTYGPTSTMAPGSTYGPTSSMSPGSNYAPTSSNINDDRPIIGSSFLRKPDGNYVRTFIQPDGNVATEDVDYDPTEGGNAQNSRIVSPAYNNNSTPTPYATAYSCPTFNCANTSAPTTFTSSCPTSTCTPYQTTVPPTTKPHKCQTCHSCRRCHKCNKHHKCHRKTPTNTNNR